MDNTQFIKHIQGELIELQNLVDNTAISQGDGYTIWQSQQEKERLISEEISKFRNQIGEHITAQARMDAPMGTL